MPSMDELVAFLAEVGSWTCRPCGKYGTGYASWMQHRAESPDCAPPHDTWGCMVPNCASCSAAAAAGTLNAGRTAEDLYDGATAADPHVRTVRWWIALNADGVELRRERRAYRPGDTWWCGAEAMATAALGFAETATGPILLVVPVRAQVRRGDRIAVAGPASGGQVPVTVIPAPQAVCAVPDCGCSGLAHP